MRILNPSFNWQAQNLPDGLSIHNGVISGTPTTLGSFSVPVTVSNSLGTSSKNISIVVRNKPGSQKFSILQNGVEIEKVSIPELQAMVQNGSAQEKYNCNNTQIVLPISLPVLYYIQYVISNIYDTVYMLTEPTSVNVPVNFCDFRNVTLQDGTTKPGLIMQFDRPLWPFSIIFDAYYSSSISVVEDVRGLNRWKYSMLRNWLNSSGPLWFSKTYSEQATPEYLQSVNEVNEWSGVYMTYPESTGFLDFLPDDLLDILQPIKVQTQAFFDDNNSFGTDEPDYIDGEDVDVTYDKIFIPSLEEMNINVGLTNFPAIGIEGSAWQYYKNLFNSQSQVNIQHSNSLQNKLENYVGKEDMIHQPSLREILTRSANSSNLTEIWRVGDYSINYASEHGTIAKTYKSAPVPAFAIC